MSVQPPQIKAVLFDWGDTLMVDFPNYSGSMVNWPVVQAIPGAEKLLADLHGYFILCVATNAVDSDEAAIRAALSRVGLNRYIDRIYCQRGIGFTKPSVEFFTFVLNDLSLESSAVLMVGDSFSTDVIGANRSGLWAIWLNRRNLEEQTSEMYRTIHELSQLPPILADWQPGG